MTHIELFAGVGGFGLAFDRAGFKTVARVEIDKYAQRVLRFHYPTDLLLSDVREAGAHNLPCADVISFGSPCQDLSVAGKRDGIGGKRSGLFFEAIRIISELKPSFAVWENVPGALSAHSGRDFYHVLNAFYECGARDIAWSTLDAQYFRVAQRRRRLFVVADFRGERAAQVLFERESGTGDTQPRQTERQAASDIVGTLTSSNSGKSSPGNASETDIIVPFTRVHGQQAYGAYQDDSAVASTLGVSDYKSVMDLITYCVKGAAIGRKVEAGPQYGEIATDVSYTLNATETHAVIAFPWQNSIANSMTPLNDMSPVVKANTVNAVMQNGVRRLTPLECERLQGFPDGWTAVDNMPDSQRYKQMGNAIAVPVVEWIARRIAAVESETL